MELFQRVGDYITDPLQKKIEGIVKQLDAADALRYELALTKCTMKVILNGRRMAVLRPKDKMVTDLDRKIEVEGATAQIEADYEFLCTLENIMAERLELGRLWLQVTS